MADLTQSNQPTKATWLQTMLAQSQASQPTPAAQKPVTENAPVAPSVPKPPALRPEELGQPATQPVARAAEPDLGSLLTYGTEGQPFASGPDSGSILKVLSATPGIKERILQGSSKGHSFQIIHVPGNPNFFLCETWTENVKDPVTGQVTPMPKKRYDPFVITEPSPLRGAPDTPAFQAPPLKEGAQPLSRFGLTATPKEAASDTSSSLDLLKNKFAKVTVEQKFEPVISTNPLEDMLTSVYGTERAEWEKAQNIPLDAFLHPETFAWGTNADGSQIERTLESFPPASRKLRDRLVPLASRLSNAGTDMSGLTVGTALEKAASENLIA